MGFNTTVCSQHFAAEIGKVGAATPGAAGLCLHQPGREHIVEVVDQHPGAAVRHAHGAAGRGDGAVFGDEFQETGLARSQFSLVADIDAEREAHTDILSLDCGAAPGPTVYKLILRCEQVELAPVPTVSMTTARAQFSRLVALVEAGSEKEIIIARNGRPVARLVGLETQSAGIRVGLARGQFVVPEDIDETNDEIAELFGVAG